MWSGVTEPSLLRLKHSLIAPGTSWRGAARSGEAHCSAHKEIQVLISGSSSDDLNQVLISVHSRALGIVHPADNTVICFPLYTLPSPMNAVQLLTCHVCQANSSCHRSFFLCSSQNPSKITFNFRTFSLVWERAFPSKRELNSPLRTDSSYRTKQHLSHCPAGICRL